MSLIIGGICVIYLCINTVIIRFIYKKILLFTLFQFKAIIEKVRRKDKLGGYICLYGKR